MHYGRTAFSRNGQPTIVPLTAGATIGQRTGLSATDIATIRAMYPNLQPTRTWMGVQFRGTARAGQTQCWFTHSWPAYWHVDWTVVPLSPPRDAGPQIEWNVRVTRQTDTAPGYGGLLKYFICIKNLVNQTAVQTVQKLDQREVQTVQKVNQMKQSVHNVNQTAVQTVQKVD
jgi:hypothetical protein